MISNPPILVLDEPTVGLDPRQMNEVRQLIGELGKDHTVILSSHILAEVSMICRRVIILNKGRIAAMDTTENLTSGVADTGRFLLTVKGAPADTEQVLGSVSGIPKLQADAERRPDPAEATAAFSWRTRRTRRCASCFSRPSPAARSRSSSCARSGCRWRTPSCS